MNASAEPEKQTQFKPNTNPKQTQFPKSQKMNVNAFSQKDYENETTFRPQKNKPNSNPIKPISKAASTHSPGQAQIIEFTSKIV